MAEITETGYQLKNQNEWFSEERDRYLVIDANWNLDVSTPDGLKLATDSEVWANLDELGQSSYNSKDPNKAKGLDLDILAAITGTFRDQGTFSTVTLTLAGTPGAVITEGSIVESSVDESRWTIVGNHTLAGNGEATAQATANVVGSTQASIDTITRIISTVAGWQTVTNPGPAVPGTDVQSDAELRLARNNGVSRPGNNQVDSMFGEIQAVVDVTRVKIYENDTGSVDGNGLPAHSIAPVVEGGTDADVALAVYFKKNPGVALHAAGTSVVESVTSPVTGNEKDITFSRPIAVVINVAVTVEDDGSLPGDVDDLIEQAILDYALGETTTTEDNFNQLGFDIAEDVVLSRIYTPINSVIGSFGNSYVSVLTLNGGGANIAIAFNELSQWLAGNIVVTIN